MRVFGLAFVLAILPAGVHAQAEDDNPIRACDLPEIRFAFDLDYPEWELACDEGTIAAVRLVVEDNGEVGATLVWRSSRGLGGRTDLRALLGPDEGSLFSELIDFRFLPALHGYRRLSLVTGTGEDFATRIEHQIWFRVRGDGRWVVAFGGRADGSEHENGVCHRSWRTTLARRGRFLFRRWRFERTYDGTEAEERAACEAEGERLHPRRVRLRRTVLVPDPADAE